MLISQNRGDHPLHLRYRNAQREGVSYELPSGTYQHRRKFLASSKIFRSLMIQSVRLAQEPGSSTVENVDN